jgi:hypothetical protein
MLTRTNSPYPKYLPRDSLWGRGGPPVIAQDTQEVVKMRRSLLMLTAALIMTATMGIAAGPAWGQNQGGGCDGYEGDHGTSCLPVINDECEDVGWQPFDVFDNLFENQDWCIQAY